MIDPERGPTIRTLRLGAGTSWPARIAAAIIGAALLVAAFFFVTIALAAGAAVGLVLAVRWWWRNRRGAATVPDGVVEGEYVVIERETRTRITPPSPPGD